MSRILSRFGLPLLARELIEQAARRRTYVIRVLYAFLLFCLSFVIFYDTLSLGAASPTAAMGRGREIFVVLVGLQFAGIYLFMPAMTCSILTYHTRQFDLTLYVACSALSVGIYLPMVSWLALLIGLKVRTQARAIIGSLAAIVIWCAGPILLVTMPLELLLVWPRWGRAPEGWRQVLIRFSALLSPATIIPFNEFNALNEFADWRWLPVILNFVGYGACLVYLRKVCLANADRLLGRVGTDAPKAVIPAREPPPASRGAELQTAAPDGGEWSRLG